MSFSFREIAGNVLEQVPKERDEIDSGKGQIVHHVCARCFKVIRSFCILTARVSFGGTAEPLDNTGRYSLHFYLSRSAERDLPSRSTGRGSSPLLRAFLVGGSADERRYPPDGTGSDVPPFGQPMSFHRFPWSVSVCLPGTRPPGHVPWQQHACPVSLMKYAEGEG